VTKDIRIAITFPNHPKTIKLRRKIGHKGVDCLLKLWCFCGEYRPKGDMSNMSDEDVAIAAGWDEDPKVFIAALLEVGYIRARHATADNNARYYLHGWKDHNPWAYYSDERSSRARESASHKWGGTSYENRMQRSKRLSDARAKGRHTREEWEALFLICGEKCLRCGSTEEIVKDHITPIYQGGSDGIENIQPLCRSCNSSKGPDDRDLRPVGWYKRLRNACETPAKRLQNACGVPAMTPAPSPSPSPSPLPPPGGPGGPTSPSDEAKDALRQGIAMLLGQFNADERDLVDKFLAQAASERKSGKMADRTRHTLLNELFQVRADFPDRFLAGMEETTDREAPNINYLRKVIANLGQQKQRSLKFRDAQRRREEYEAKRKAQEKLDRAHERNMEDRKRRERARQEAGTHGPGRGGAAGGDMPRHGQGHGPEGDRRPPQNDKEQGAPAAAQGRGAVGDRGNGAPYTEVSLSDHIGPASPGASHADGEQPGDGDDGCGALVPA